MHFGFRYLVVVWVFCACCLIHWLVVMVCWWVIVIVNSGVVCVWFTYSCGFVVLDFG